MTELVNTILERMKPEKKSLLTETQIWTLYNFDHDRKDAIELNLSIITRKNDIYNLCQFVRTVKKEFQEVEESDIRNFIKSQKADSTKTSWQILFRKFYKWLYQTEDYPEIVSWMKPIKNTKKKSPKDLLTEGDVDLLISFCILLRDKGLISFLYDSAVRVAEATGIKIGDVENNGKNIVIKVTGKTGSRKVGLITSAPYISRLLDEHPLKHDKDAYLFFSLNHSRRFQRLSTDGVRRIIKDVAKRANIKKPVNPHNFRHSQLTDLSRKGMTETSMKIFAGWSDDSSMPSTYIHLTESEVDDIRTELVTGVKREEVRKPTILLPLICPACHEKNPSTYRYCTSCMNPLHPIIEKKYKNRMDSMQQQITNMSEKMNLINEAINSKFGKAMLKNNNGKPRISVIDSRIPYGEIFEERLEAPPFNMSVEEIADTYSILKNRKSPHLKSMKRE